VIASALMWRLAAMLVAATVVIGSEVLETNGGP